MPSRRPGRSSGALPPRYGVSPSFAVEVPNHIASFRPDVVRLRSGDVVGWAGGRRIVPSRKGGTAGGPSPGGYGGPRGRGSRLYGPIPRVRGPGPPRTAAPYSGRAAPRFPPSPRVFVHRGFEDPLAQQ